MKNSRFVRTSIMALTGLTVWLSCSAFSRLNLPFHKEAWVEIKQNQQNKGWISLFNGKNLQGWHTIPGGKWEVQNGMIVGTSPKSDERHGLLVTDESFGDFTLEVTYKAIKGNSGLYFRAKEVGGVVGVHGFQAEIDPEKDAGGLYETGGRAWVVQPRPEDVKTWYKPNEWNTMTVTAIGRNVVVHVNGKKTAELTDDPGLLEGRIALQLHGGQDMHVLFKEVKLRREPQPK